VSRAAVRSLAVVAGLAVGSMAAAPAFATTAAKPTSLTLKAAKSSVAPKQKDTLTGLLKSGTHTLAGDTVKLERRAYGAKSFVVVASKTTDSKGRAVLTVTPGTRKGQKVQYELVFSGTKSYKASHSSIITVTVS
jgi:hypothetical protein